MNLKPARILAKENRELQRKNDYLQGCINAWYDYEGKQNTMTRSLRQEIVKLSAANAELVFETCRHQRELDVTDKLLDARNEVIDMIPECPAHGAQCLPNAKGWITKHLKRDKKRAKKKAAKGEYHICNTCACWCDFPACGGVSLDREPIYDCKNWVSRDD